MPLLRPLLLVLPLLLPTFATAQTFQVTTDVNDVTGVRRTVSADLRPLPTSSYPGSHAAFRAIHEQDPDEGTSWELVLFGYAPDTTAMSRTTQVRLQADGKEMTPSRIVSRTRPMRKTLVEIKRVGLTHSQFEQVAQADSVTVVIGSVQFDLSRVRRTDMRLILDRVSSSPPPQRALDTGTTDTSATPNGDD